MKRSIGRHWHKIQQVRERTLVDTLVHLSPKNKFAMTPRRLRKIALRVAFVKREWKVPNARPA